MKRAFAYIVAVILYTPFCVSGFMALRGSLLKDEMDFWAMCFVLSLVIILFGIGGIAIKTIIEAEL